MKKLRKIITHNAVDAVDAAGSATTAGWHNVGDADFGLVTASCDSGTTSCVWSLEFRQSSVNGAGQGEMTNGPFIDVDESFPPDPTAGLHTVATGRAQLRLFDLRGVDAFRLRLNTRTGADEVFSSFMTLLREGGC